MNDDFLVDDWEIWRFTLPPAIVVLLGFFVVLLKF